MPGGPSDDSPSDGEFFPPGRRTTTTTALTVGICDGCLTRRRLVGDSGFCAECEYFAVGVVSPAPGPARDRPVSAWNGVRYVSVPSGDRAARRELRERLRERDRARLREIDRELGLRDVERERSERERERMREIERERDRARERARELARELARERERRYSYSGYYSDSDLDSGF